MGLINARLSVAPFVTDVSTLKKTQFTTATVAVAVLRARAPWPSEPDFEAGIEIIMI